MPKLSTAYATVDGEAIRYDGELIVMECHKCAIAYAVPASFDRLNHVRKGREWWCPNGHGAAYQTTEEERLQSLLDSARGAVEHAQDRYNEEKRSHSATKGQLTKVKRRAEAGTCPHCKRSFVQMRRHITKRHPDKELIHDPHPSDPVEA